MNLRALVQRPSLWTPPAAPAPHSDTDVEAVPLDRYATSPTAQAPATPVAPAPVRRGRVKPWTLAAGVTGVLLGVGIVLGVRFGLVKHAAASPMTPQPRGHSSEPPPGTTAFPWPFLRAPAAPLAVAHPYLSTWSPSTTLTDAAPMFWEGHVKDMAGFVRVDGQPYRYLGLADGTGAVAQQVGLTISATQTRYAFTAGGVNLTVDFMTPVAPDDMRALSIPFSSVAARAVSGDGGAHAVQLYMDITGTWAHGAPDADIVWSMSPGAGFQAFTLAPANPQIFAEVNQYPSWGSAIFAAAEGPDLRFEANGNATTRHQFAATGLLNNTVDARMPRAINNDTPTFAFARNLGVVNDTSVAEQHFYIGHVRSPAINYMGQALAPHWESYWNSWQEMLGSFVIADRNGTALARASSWDEAIALNATRVGGPKYGALNALSFRQSLGGAELVHSPSGSADEPWRFMKEISSDGNVNTVGMIYSTFPFLAATNPEALRQLLTPLLAYAESGDWPRVFAQHDIGSHYPNATGHNDGGGENMPVQSCAQMIVLMAAYMQSAGEDVSTTQAFIKQHYPIMRQWSDYLLQNALIPGAQLEIPDFEGVIPNSTNLALLGIMGLGAMAKIAHTVNEAGDAQRYQGAAENFIQQWQAMGMDPSGTHMELAYDRNDSWSLLFNLYPNRYLKMNLVSDDLSQKQTSWYAQQITPFGIPLNNGPTNAKSDWTMLTAGAMCNATFRSQLIDAVYNYVQDTPDRIPLSDWYNATNGVGEGSYRARPVVGGHFAVAALPADACDANGVAP